MSPASLNHVFRLVWSDRLQAYVAVPEAAHGRGKAGRARRRRPGLRRRLAALASMAWGSAWLAGTAWAAGPLPTGANVAAGQASITQSANSLTVQQQSQRLVTNWQSFSVGAGNTVNFAQPSSSAVALNRVLGSDVSSIQGSINANGQVFLLNPNGVVFGPQSRVSTGGLVASTLSMTDDDFMAGRYRLQGDSTASVVNQGHLGAAGGGTVALVAAQVVNQGGIEATGGQVLIGAGQDVTLDFGGPVPLQIHRGALDALIENGGAVVADGGRVLMSTKAADELSSAVINQTGVVRARTLATGASGEIVLIGDMAHGRLDVGGTLDVSAPAGGTAVSSRPPPPRCGNCQA